MTTLSTLGQSDLVRSEFSTLQGSIQQLQTQIATGQKTQLYGDLGAQATLDINLRNQANLIDNFKKNISDISIRTKLIDQSLVTIHDTALAVQNQAFSSPSFPAQRVNIVAAAKAAIDQITQSLQTSVGGRNLFGGTQTQSSPVTPSATLLPTVQAAVAAAIAAGPASVPAAIQAAVSGPGSAGPPVVAPGVVATAARYYLGGPPHAPSQIDQGLTVDYSITASDPAFLTLMQGLYTLAALPQPGGPTAVPPALSDSQFDATASAAASTISQGLTQLQSLTEKNGRNEQFLTDESTAHDATLTVLQTQIDNIEQVNLADASTRLSQLTTQLNASYRVTANLSTLNLVDFLK
jgi:flagellar hook-associated protein 3 FlgL